MPKQNEDQKPGPIWGGWWFWEPPPGKVMETPEDTFKRLHPEDDQ